MLGLIFLLVKIKFASLFSYKFMHSFTVLCWPGVIILCFHALLGDVKGKTEAAILVT